MTVRESPALRIQWLWIGFVGLETAAQLSLKMAATTNHALGMSAWIGALLTNHWFQISILCDAVNFLMWMTILRRHDLSLAVPLSSLCYGAIVLLSFLLLHEPITGVQLIGLCTIGAGVIVLAKDNATPQH